MDISMYKEDIIKTIQKVVQFDTVQSDPVPGGPFGQGNKECLEYVLDVASKMGFKVKNLDGYCGYAEVGEGDELMGIVGHLDVVPVGTGWKYPPFSGEIVGDEMWGRGTWDDKGPAIVSLYAVKALMDSGFKFNKRVRVIFGCNEESGSLCMDHYREVEGQIDYGFSPDANFPVIYGEKSITNIFVNGTSKSGDGVQLVSLHSGIVINAVPDVCTFTLSYACPKCKAKAMGKIEEAFKETSTKYDVVDENNTLTYTVYGKAAHGSMPEIGKNAANFAIDALKDVVDNEFIKLYSTYIKTEYNGKSLGCFATDEYGDLVVNVGIVDYEEGKYSIKINSRLPFTTTCKKQYEEIKETLKNENCVVTLEAESEGFIMDKDSKMIQIMIDAYQSVTKDYTSKPLVIGGGTYAKEFNNCVAYGPEMDMYGELLIHQPNERINLKAIDAIMEIYTKAIARLVSEVSFK